MSRVDPRVTLIQDAQGYFIGTTDEGGAHGFGTVFKMSPKGSEKVLYSFTAGPHGYIPVPSSLIQDAQGNLYGTPKTAVPTATARCLW